MGDVVNVHEAKTHLSRLLERVEHGEEIVIGRSGKAVARLVPVAPRRPRRPGRWKDRVSIAPDLDDADGELIDLFAGADSFEDAEREPN